MLIGIEPVSEGNCGVAFKYVRQPGIQGPVDPMLKNTVNLGYEIDVGVEKRASKTCEINRLLGIHPSLRVSITGLNTSWWSTYQKSHLMEGSLRVRGGRARSHKTPCMRRTTSSNKGTPSSGVSELVSNLYILDRGSFWTSTSFTPLGCLKPVVMSISHIVIWRSTHCVEVRQLDGGVKFQALSDHSLQTNSFIEGVRYVWLSAVVSNNTYEHHHDCKKSPWQVKVCNKEEHGERRNSREYMIEVSIDNRFQEGRPVSGKDQYTLPSAQWTGNWFHLGASGTLFGDFLWAVNPPCPFGW